LSTSFTSAGYVKQLCKRTPKANVNDICIENNWLLLSASFSTAGYVEQLLKRNAKKKHKRYQHRKQSFCLLHLLVW